MSHRPRRDARRRSAGMAMSKMSTAAECSEERVLLSAAAIDGTGNNLQNPEWGSTEETFLRLAEAEYADAISAVGGEDRPSARLISNVVSDSGGQDIISDRLLSAMIYTWGQFIDHDITLTESGTTEKLSIPVPTGDASFDPLGTGTKTIDTLRSAFDDSTGTDASNPREQVNLITAFVDGSMVYGSDAETATSLRAFTGGLMKTSDGDLLPVGDGGMFQAGDIRANENPALTSLQTLFVREHNARAKQIAAANPSLSDEKIFQRARSIVIAEIQAITYNEWLPTLLGRGAIDKYTGYDSTVNPGISNEFATAAFRFGHSLLGNDLEFLNNKGLPVRDEVSLSEAFFNPSLVSENGIDSILKYDASTPSMEVDTEVVDGVRNFLFGPPGAGGLDLASLNIERGRDHGLADYNTTREAVGLPRVTSFANITSDTELQAELESLYGTVDNIDLWVGGLAEDHARGSSVGETFQTIIADQFERLRDGDRYWFENQFSGKQLATLRKTSLSDIIERNTDLTTVQQNAFFFKASISGVVTIDQNRNQKSDRQDPPASGIKLQLINTADGEVVATTKTDRRGHYEFSVDDGLRTGIYKLQTTKPDGTVLTTSRRVSITGGDDFERVNLSVPVPPKPAKPQSPPPKHSNGNQAITSSKSSTTSKATSDSANTGSVAGLTSTKSSETKISTDAAKKTFEGTKTSTTSSTFSSAALASSVARLHSLIDSLFETLPPGLL